MKKNKLIDKFNIIENNSKDLSHNDILSIIENYIFDILNEPLFDISIKTDNIKNIILFNQDIQYNIIIETNIQKYINNTRKDITNKLSSETYNLDDLNNNIISYQNIINNLQQIFNIKEETIYFSYKCFYENIISEPLLVNLLQKTIPIINRNNSVVFKIIDFLVVLRSYNITDSGLNWFLHLVSMSFKIYEENNYNVNKHIPQRYNTMICLSKTIMRYNDIRKIYYKSVKFEYKEIILSDIRKYIDDIIYHLSGELTFNELCLFLKNHSSYYASYREEYGDKINDSQRNLILLMLKKEIDKINNITLLEEFIVNFLHIQNVLIFIPKQYIVEQLSSFFNKNDNIIMLIKIICNDINYHYILSYTSDKILFMEIYNRLLIQRLLYTKDIEKEENNYRAIKNHFPKKLLNKTDRILSDMKKSCDVMIKINSKECDLYSHKSYFVTTSYDNWDINQDEGNIVLSDVNNNSLLYNSIYTYTYNYISDVKNIILLWYPHFGEIIFTFNNMDFKMLPIQYLVLEEIATKSLSYKDYINLPFLKNYNMKFRDNIIKSLCYGRIISHSNLHSNLHSNDLFTLSYDTNIKTDYINIFFTTTDYMDIWEQKRNNEIVMRKEDIISSLINHFVKKQSMTSDNLYNTISENMKLFIIMKEMYHKVVEDMIKKDYIKYENELLVKLIY